MAKKNLSWVGTREKRIIITPRHRKRIERIRAGNLYQSSRTDETQGGNVFASLQSSRSTGILCGQKGFLITNDLEAFESAKLDCSAQKFPLTPPLVPLTLFLM